MIILLLIIAVCSAFIYPPDSTPANATDQSAANITLCMRCIGNETNYTMSFILNTTLVGYYTLQQNNTWNCTSIGIGSNVYNYTAQCTNPYMTESNQTLHRIGFYQIRSYSVNVSTPSYDYPAFEAYITSFMTDWWGYVAALVAFGMSYLVTRNLQSTALAGAIALLGIFFITLNPVFLAGTVLALLAALALKYFGG